MAAFAFHVAVVAFSAYSLSGAVLAGVVIIGMTLHWDINRRVIPTMMGWGAVGVVALAFVTRALEVFTQG